MILPATKGNVMNCESCGERTYADELRVFEIERPGDDTVYRVVYCRDCAKDWDESRA